MASCTYCIAVLELQHNKYTQACSSHNSVGFTRSARASLRNVGGEAFGSPASRRMTVVRATPARSASSAWVMAARNRRSRSRISRGTCPTVDESMAVRGSINVPPVSVGSVYSPARCQLLADSTPMAEDPIQHPYARLLAAARRTLRADNDKELGEALLDLAVALDHEGRSMTSEPDLVLIEQQRRRRLYPYGGPDIHDSDFCPSRPIKPGNAGTLIHCWHGGLDQKAHCCWCNWEGGLPKFEHGPHVSSPQS